MEFLSDVKRKPRPLEMRQERRVTLPDEAQKRTLLSG